MCDYPQRNKGKPWLMPGVSLKRVLQKLLVLGEGGGLHSEGSALIYKCTEVQAVIRPAITEMLLHSIQSKSYMIPIDFRFSLSIIICRYASGLPPLLKNKMYYVFATSVYVSYCNLIAAICMLKTV